MDQMTTLQKIEAAEDLLERLADSHGKVRCRIICALSDLMGLIRNDVLILEEKTKDAEIKMEEKGE